MNICFVANYYKTYFFHEVAKRLQAEGVNVFWVVVNKRLNDFLLENYNKNNVLYISKSDSFVDRDPVGDYRLNELVYGDRVLRHESAEWPYRFLRNIQKEIFDFVDKNQIRFVFGEVTWAHEILFHRLLADHPELNCKYLCPHTIRIPGGRFAFFVDEFQSVLYEVPGSQTNFEAVSPFEVKKPDYLAINDKILKSSRSIGARLARVKRFITRENIDPFDPTLISSRWTSLRLRISEELNKELYRFIKKAPFTEAISSQPYVFVALHKQPEASIDVIGRYYEDQARNITNVWRALPEGWLLLVKEHSNAIGDRPPGFYRNLNKLRNLVFVDERTDSYKLIENCQAVVTVSGTVAYEAALLGKRSFTFAPCFFNRFEKCNKLDLKDFFTDDVFTKSKDCVAGDFDSYGYIYSNSYPGNISDVVSNPLCISDENITMVATSFIKVLK